MLKLGKSFVMPVPELPPTLTHLLFAEHSKFNLPLPPLPSSLTHLHLGTSFNQDVSLVLSDSLTHLTFGADFNKQVTTWPPTLRQLKFGPSFNQPLGDLPSHLTHLKLGKNFSQKVPKLPLGITHLWLEGYTPGITTKHLRMLSSLVQYEMDNAQGGYAKISEAKRAHDWEFNLLHLPDF